jgi:hypothetical protein
MACRDRLLQVLQGVTKIRIGDPWGPEGWIIKEQEAMWRGINEERAKLGKGPVSLARVIRADGWASGHFDYAEKMALYCAEIVFDKGGSV